MLVELKVSNFALIEDLSLEFGPGLNVLSGETGAGKSVVIGAVNLLLGERAATEQIRRGGKKTYVEGIFNCEGAAGVESGRILEGAGLYSEGELILAREVYSNGRSVARVNGRAVPVSFLRELGGLLVDLHGQHQHQSLLRPDQHLELLDAFGGEKLEKLADSVREVYHRRKELKKELSALGESGAERERMLDINTFQLKEIIDAGLSPGEDGELSGREKVLANSEKLVDAAAEVYSEIYGGEDNTPVVAVIDRLKRSAGILNEAAGIDPALAQALEMVEGACAHLEEVAIELRHYRSTLEFDPGELAATQDRLNKVNALKRKYGSTIEEVLAYGNRLEQDIERLKNSESLAEEIALKINGTEEELAGLCLALRSLRLETARTLESRLEKALADLALPGARFEVCITEKSSWTSRGTDQVEFLFSANRGEEVRPLVKIISGGEVSRVMLALKTILARQDLVPTLVFDEVDAGIGGATIQAVAEKLAHLADHHQVLCVTHSPQIAAMADIHFHLFKETAADRTLTRAVTLSDGKRREELARMLDGASIDRVSLEHVDSLLRRAENFKKRSAH